MAPAEPSGASDLASDALRWATSVSETASELLPTPELPEERRQQVRRLFQELDRNGDGTLDADELQGALKLLGLPRSPEYVHQIMSQYGVNGSGKVDADAFHDYACRKEETIWRSFQEIDLDRTGEVDEEELLQALKKLGMEKVTPEDTERMIQLLDRDGDRQIDYEEYRRFVMLLPANQLSEGGIVTSWIDSADWMSGIEYRLSLAPPQQLYERLVAGGIAGAVSRTVVAPLERLRTMMMADARNKSLAATARKMWADGGARGLFTGNLATVTKVVPQCAIQMAVYDTVKDFFQAATPDKKLTNLQRLAAGLSAGAASTLATYPMENLRTHVSLGRKGGYLKILNDIYKERGMSRGVYGGFVPCMVNTVTTVGLGFFSYEVGCDLYKTHILDTPRSPTPGERGVIAGCSAIGVMTLTMPLEVVTRRMQIQGSPGHPVRYASMADCFGVMLREEGPRAFWRGTLSSFMKVVPSIAIVRYMYEAINAFKGTNSIRGYRGPRPEAKAAAA